MKLLLDTHCLIWALTDAPALNARARVTIARAEVVGFSEASVWEIGLKWRNRLSTPPTLHISTATL